MIKEIPFGRMTLDNLSKEIGSSSYKSNDTSESIFSNAIQNLTILPGTTLDGNVAIKPGLND